MDFQSEKILAIFDLQVAQYFPPSFESVRMSVKEKFLDDDRGGHLAFSIGTILDICNQELTPILPTKFRVNWPFRSGEGQNRFLRRRPSCISDKNALHSYGLQLAPILHTNFPVNWPFRS